MTSGACYELRSAANDDLDYRDAGPLCKIDRTEREGFDVPVPQQPGRYVVSVLKISDDGDVGAATLAIDVR